jgi:predicted DNA-binding transcriptional regulator AlpA
MAEAPEWITRRELLALLGTSKATFHRHLRREPTFPRPATLGPKTLRWSRSAVSAWLVRQTQAPAS